MSSPQKYLFILLQDFQEAQQMMKVELKKAKGYYDLSLRVNIFYPGDVIYLLNKATKKGRAKKLEHIWQSPAVITHMITPFLFRK